MKLVRSLVFLPLLVLALISSTIASAEGGVIEDAEKQQDQQAKRAQDQDPAEAAEMNVEQADGAANENPDVVVEDYASDDTRP